MIVIILWVSRPSLPFQFYPEVILSFASNPFQSLIVKALTPKAFTLEATLLRFFSLQHPGLEKVSFSSATCLTAETLRLHGLLTALAPCLIQDRRVFFHTPTLMRFPL